MRMALLTLSIVAVLMTGPAGQTQVERLVWPPAPDQARLEYVRTLDLDQLKPSGGLLARIGRLIGGKSESDLLTLPFDVVHIDRSLFVVCQNIPALVEIDLTKGNFKTHTYKKYPFLYPIAVCRGGEGTVFVTDPEASAVFRYADGKVRTFIDTGLVRPVGIAALPELQRVYVVDTGDQSLKIFDYSGNLIRVVGDSDDGEVSFNFPTFAAAAGPDQILVNDALNYQVKRFDADGNLIGFFGQEGDGPGTFARAKGVAVDSDNHVYVVDNLFDNFQVFNEQGQVLLAVGSAGQGQGQFWSPAGIDIVQDTIYVADTYNNRIQVLHYLGSDQ